MAKQRMINTKFWSDGFVVDNLNPLDRYLFLYLMTNEKTNISGIYQIPLTVISRETGIDKETLSVMFRTLAPKVYYIDDWVILTNFIKNQNYESPKIKVGIFNELSVIPEKVLKYAFSIGYAYGIDTYAHLNLNLNLNSKNSNASVVSPEQKPKKPTSQRGWANLRRLEAGKPPLKTPRTQAQVRALAELLKIQPYINLYKALASEKGLSYIDFPEEMNQKLRRQFLNALARFGEDTENFIRWIFTGNHQWAKKTQYNPESCVASFMFDAYKNKEVKEPETNEERAKRLLIAARKRGGPDDDESDYRMWARNDFQKELGIRDQAFTDSDLYKSVKHIIGL